MLNLINRVLYIPSFIYYEFKMGFGLCKKPLKENNPFEEEEWVYGGRGTKVKVITSERKKKMAEYIKKVDQIFEKEKHDAEQRIKEITIAE